MIWKKSEYKVKKEDVESIGHEISKFVDAVHENEPGTYFEAYQIDDMPSFLHIMQFPNEEAEKKHHKASYTQDFVEQLYPKCTKGPKITEMHHIGS